MIMEKTYTRSIRHTQSEDLDAVMEIYAYARSFMAAHGNPRQWGATNWPPKTLIEKDIARGKSYVCEERTTDSRTGETIDTRVVGVFYYDYGPAIEPCYAEIEEGDWLNDTPYGVVHRIASAEDTKGVGTFCLEWAYDQSGHLRIDTHPDNTVMQSFLKKQGFTYCGIIHVEEDNDPRYAYEKVPCT